MYSPNRSPAFTDHPFAVTHGCRPHTSIRVILIADPTVAPACALRCIESQTDMCLVAALASTADAMQSRGTYTPDVIVLYPRDRDLPEMSELTAVHQGYPDARVIMFMSLRDARTARNALRAGAAALLEIGTSWDNLLSVIRTVHRGARHVPTDLALRLIEQYGGQNLTAREFEILCHIRDGYRNKQIAHKLAIAEATVSFHVKNLTDKLQANDRTHAVVVALRRGLLDM